MPLPITTILTDIEGTTSAVSFVFDVLFPYAREHLPAFVLAHAERPDVAEQLQAARVTAAEPDASTERVVEILLQWLAEDRKATPLKALQGMVWAEGYQAGTLKGHVYPDAVQALRQWHAQGLALYVYSSGSVQAQKLIFGCSEHGDLTPLFSGYFDTTSGGKREAAAYRAIAQAMGVVAQSVLFLSDIVEELDAASEAGMQTCGVAREGGVLMGHETVKDFSRIVLHS